VFYEAKIGRKYVNFNNNFFQLLFLFLLLTSLFFQLLLQLKLIYIIQLLLQLQLTATYFSVIFLFHLQLTEGTLRHSYIIEFSNLSRLKRQSMGFFMDNTSSLTLEAAKFTACAWRRQSSCELWHSINELSMGQLLI